MATIDNSLSPAMRLTEIAVIFARGILRLRHAVEISQALDAEVGTDSSSPSLENSGQTRLNVTRPGADAVPKKASRRGASNTTPALTTTTL